MNERGELFTLDEQLNAANKECDELIEENTKLQAQVSSLTKERDELKNDIEKRMQVADKIFKENRDLNSQLSNRDKENHELSSWEYGEFLKPNSEKCKAQSSVFDALKSTHSMLPSLLLSQRNGGLAIEDWRALSNAGHTIKSNAQKVVTALEEGEEE
ncbi:MAG: hypothetical protein DHS20C07_18880 [Methyloligella sp.]|nr:MAG: hypothetical protein DHS20C07_18880 [Methyloligella sp.]